MTNIPIISIDKSIEGVRIFCPEVKILVTEVSESQMPETTKFTGVSHEMMTSNSHTNKNLKGNLLVILRNQGGDFKQAIFVEGEFVIRYSDPDTPSEAFTKGLQYLFEWVREYVDENEITDSTGAKFEVPEFLYSKDQFFFP